MFGNFGSSSETLGKVRAFVEFRSLGRVWAFGQVQRLGSYQGHRVKLREYALVCFYVGFIVP